MSERLRPEGRRGFALALVVFFLLAVSFTAATGYLLVDTDFALANRSAEGTEALAVARAGLHRFVAEQIGVVGDSVTYAIGDGTATITTRKLLEKDSVTDVYMIRSEGEVGGNLVASEVVRGYAIHHRRPLAHYGTIVVAAPQLEIYDGGRATGYDYNGSGDCEGGGTSGITGGIAKTTAVTSGSGILTGNPNSTTWTGGHAAIYDSVALRWDVLTDPSFPVDFEDAPPSWWTIPSDSFPVIRYNGNLYADNPWDGRGVLIVTGQFDSGPGHDWNGIILAGWLDDIMQGDVNGMVIGGLDRDSPYTRVEWRGSARYYSCYVYEANESLSYMELIQNSVVEGD